MFPAQASAPLPPAPVHQPTAPRPGGSKKLLAVVAGLVIIGGIVAIAVVAAGGRKNSNGDQIDLENEELAMVRDQACACKDEACQREAVGQLDDIEKRADASGVKGTKAQHALGSKTFDEIGECVSKGSKSAPTATAASGGDIVADMMALRDAVCACKDAACAASLKPEFDRWRDKYRPTFDSLPAAVKRQTFAVTAAQKQCVDRLNAHANDGVEPSAAVFAGRYKTSEGAMTLEQTTADPTRVSGTYAKGTITCQASGDQLDCAWIEPRSSGHAHFERAETGDLAGTWGHGDGATDGGAWTCTLMEAGALR